ncbi:MAG: hypothetical protein IBX50_18985 [Marinospirillum sp.]|uniref:hypothetical protein n=1 Tax=Marinospirillum sp. TaxID=2183934 RepID=UPI0019E6EC95|nr:hypothetical protein [Marinospirillum sp.]MBE0508775.1 hypothetical protein [Marinospirillum sp.]
MRWQEIQSICTGVSPEIPSSDQQAGEEKHFAQMLAARLLILAQKKRLLSSHIDWQSFYIWLGVDVRPGK